VLSEDLAGIRHHHKEVCDMLFVIGGVGEHKVSFFERSDECLYRRQASTMTKSSLIDGIRNVVKICLESWKLAMEMSEYILSQLWVY
jgi:hypothetical protein